MTPTSVWDPLGPTTVGDPISAHARLREDAPVAYSDRWGGFWALTRYDDVVAAARDTTSFSSRKGAIPPSTGPNDPPRAPLEIDPPMHDAYRRLLNPFFAPRRIKAIEPLVRTIARELVTEVVASGTVDVVPGLTFPMPVRALCAFLGLPDEDGVQIKTWANDVIAAAISGNTEGHRQANAAIYGYIEGVVAERRENEQDPELDLISGLLTGGVDGKLLSDADVAGILRLLLAAGHGTTTNALGSTLNYLASNPESQARLRAEPNLIPQAIEEILRVWSPSRALGRTVARDVELGGIELHRGDKLALVWSSANRDERAFPHADEVDIDRRPNRHIAFGHGIHTCLGAPLARAEVRIVVEEVFAATSDFHSAGEVTWANWPHLGPSGLPLYFEPAGVRS